MDANTYEARRCFARHLRSTLLLQGVMLPG
ncbi:hypothetical protein SAMN05421539_10340 [Jannaschia seohaensis]|uniref:Uncharacterized protein n=1 Tax=Jannaschia seohaensis TaxID=475081 RepID=A0A2Y9BZE7_9RHOB|nr:hypothetical protein BCF38_10340 [Jannaschia seohaensis]SSA44222.1 hypothetical protein SAMN05421539_10340 [Jannaschia seohaensis]